MITSITTISGFEYERMVNRANSLRTSKTLVMDIDYLVNMYFKVVKSMSPEEKERIKSSVDLSILKKIVMSLKKNKNSRTNTVWTNWMSFVLDLILKNDQIHTSVIIPNILFDKEFELIDTLSKKYNVTVKHTLAVSKSDVEEAGWCVYGLSVDVPVERDIILHDFCKNRKNTNFLDWTSSKYHYTK